MADLLPVGPRRSSTTPLLIALGVFVVLVVIAAVAFSGGGKSSSNGGKKNPATDTPTASVPNGVNADAKAQANALFLVIGQGKDLRGQANNAITDVESCRNVAQAQATFTSISAKRQFQSDSLKTLSVDKIPGGAQLAADMQKAWQYSADSEKEYAVWAGDNLSCSGKPGSNDNKAKANSDGAKAGSAKSTVVAEWNAMAAKAGQTTIALSDL